MHGKIFYDDERDWNSFLTSLENALPKVDESKLEVSTCLPTMRIQAEFSLQIDGSVKRIFFSLVEKAARTNTREGPYAVIQVNGPPLIVVELRQGEERVPFIFAGPSLEFC